MMLQTLFASRTDEDKCVYSLQIEFKGTFSTVVQFLLVEEAGMARENHLPIVGSDAQQGSALYDRRGRTLISWGKYGHNIQA